MNKIILIGLAATALALGACGKKTPPADVGPAVTDPSGGIHRFYRLRVEQ